MICEIEFVETSVKRGMYGYTQFRKPIKVKLADDTVIFAYGKGESQLTLPDGNKKVNATLKDILYVPKIQKICYKCFLSLT